MADVINFKNKNMPIPVYQHKLAELLELGPFIDFSGINMTFLF